MSKAAGKTEGIGCYQYYLTVKLIPTDLSHIGRYKLVVKEASAMAPTQAQLLAGAGIYRWVSQDWAASKSLIDPAVSSATYNSIDYINIAYDISSTIKSYIQKNIEGGGGLFLDFDEDQMKELFLSPNTKYKLYATAVDDNQQPKDSKVLEVLSTNSNTLFTDATDDINDIITSLAGSTLEGCQYIDPPQDNSLTIPATATVDRGDIWYSGGSLLRYDPSDDAVVVPPSTFLGVSESTQWYMDGIDNVIAILLTNNPFDLPTAEGGNPFGLISHPNAKSAAYGNQRYSFIFPSTEALGRLTVAVTASNAFLWGTLQLTIDQKTPPVP